jgi:hypothetical protein
MMAPIGSSMRFGSVRGTTQPRGYSCQSLSHRSCKAGATEDSNVYQKYECDKIRRSDIVKSAMIAGISMLTTTGAGVISPQYCNADEVMASSAVLKDVGIGKVFLSTLSDCSLAVSIYPTFSYNAAGGGGIGRIVGQDGDIATVEFDPKTLNIPPIDYRSTKVIGIPIPPPLQIRIIPKELKGTVNMKTGEANLDFDAAFQFDAGSIYHAAPLSVLTTLSTEGSSGDLLQGTGNRMTADGKAKLAGVARVPKTGDAFLDSFLLLPSEALAVLSADIRFSN